MCQKTAKAVYYAVLLVLAISPDFPHPFTQWLLNVLTVVGGLQQHLFRAGSVHLYDTRTLPPYMQFFR